MIKEAAEFLAAREALGTDPFAAAHLWKKFLDAAKGLPHHITMGAAMLVVVGIAKVDGISGEELSTRVRNLYEALPPWAKAVKN